MPIPLAGHRFLTVARGFASLIVGLILLAAPHLIAAERDLSDDAIARTIEKEFEAQGLIPADAILVGVNEGIVTLQGIVSTLLARDRSVLIAGTVDGVRGIVDRIQVHPPIPRTAQAIRSDIEHSLRLDPATDLFEIGIDVSSNGVVTLSGTVQSWQERDLTEQLVRGVAGVTDVVNEIQVDISVQRSDEELLADIEQRLKWDLRVKEDRITVKVEDAKVVLSGAVGSHMERVQAAVDAWVNGVAKVIYSDLTVDPALNDSAWRRDTLPHKTDADIRAALLEALSYDPRLKHAALEVEVAEAAVTLKGTVDHLAAFHAAERTAANIVGVKAVDNRVRIVPRDRPDDETVTRQLRAALLYAADVDARDWTVNVANGVARLEGAAASLYEIVRAEEIASRINGVKAIDNRLRVVS